MLGQLFHVTRHSIATGLINYRRNMCRLMQIYQVPTTDYNLAIGIQGGPQT